jgi:hypothetical protein
MLKQVFPAGLQRGTTAEVVVSGERSFAGAYKVLFEGEGLAAEIVPPPPPKEGEAKKERPEVNQVTLKVTAAADAAVGVRELRVATPRGVSSIGVLVVGDEPEAAETEPNSITGTAQRVALPVTLNGRIGEAEDVDLFRFHARAGEQIAFSILAARLQDKIHDLQEHVDPLLTLRDATGREIARADDTYGADPLLLYRFQEEGEYLIEVRDVRYQGNAHWVYRLSLTRRPWVRAVLPLAAQRGEATSLELIGANLGESPIAQWAAPADAAPGVREVQLRHGELLTNPVPLLITDLPEWLETEVARSEALAIPCGVSGRIGAENEEDRYSYRAVKDEKLLFEVQARRYGSALDSLLWIVDSAGKEVANNDDSAGKDSRLEWTAPADGIYTVRLRDLHRRGGPEFVYHLTARRVQPDFSLRCDGDKAQIGPGGGTAWYVKVNRSGGFDGEVALSVRGLPEGVTATCGVIPPPMTEGCVILTASAGAKIDAHLVQVIGTATLPGPDGAPVAVTRVATPLQEIYTPGGGRGLFAVNLHTLSITEPQDITLAVSPERISLEPGGTARIEVTVQRRADYTKGVTLDLRLQHLGTVYGNPLLPGVTIDEAASKTLLGENETGGVIVLRAAANTAPIKDLPIAVLGQVSINFVVKVSYAAPVFLTVTPKPTGAGS